LDYAWTMNKKNWLILLSLFIIATLVLGACSVQKVEKNTYKQISAKEAKELMDTQEGYIILDVRTRAEYLEGHIPNAVLLPNESIGSTPIEQLPDKDQLILVYCRSGNRSKQASAKLVNLGYTNVHEFGGIGSWPYDIVKD